MSHVRLAIVPLILIASIAPGQDPQKSVLTGKDALGDWTTDAPGVRRKLTLDDLAKPFDTPSVKNHGVPPE